MGRKSVEAGAGDHFEDDVVATIILDIDGTLVYSGTNSALPGTSKLLYELVALGQTLVFMTQRTEAQATGLKRLLQDMTGKIDVILLCDMHNPRVVVNDLGAGAVARNTNEPWDDAGIDKVIAEARKLSYL